MKLVMTLLVRNEGDIIDAQIAFHLNAGVDFVIATDNGSEDGTVGILERYARQGHLHCIRPRDRHISQIESVTQMARLAATEFDADWVINSDGDEFWWPRGGTLKDVLAAIPPRFGAVRGMWRHFVPRPGDDFFAERMTVRLCAPGGAWQHVFIPHFKTAHRADPEIRVGGGNHDAFGRGLLPLAGWYPIDILHFPLRSFEQCERKYVDHYEWRAGQEVDPRMATAYRAHLEGRMQEFYEADVVGDLAVEQGLRDGTFEIDTRLRDALRSLGTRALRFDRATVDRGYLSEVGALEEENAVTRARRRIVSLEFRLSKLERRSRVSRR